jgi:uncharacterized membrane protein
VTGRAEVSRLRKSLWFVPVLCVLAGVVLSFATIAIDAATDYALVPHSVTGGPDAASATLQSIANSMVTLVALVLTVTMVVVQLAMGQFSPRIVATFLQDKPSQFAIGLFVATFAHAMLAMRAVDPQKHQVPGLTIVVAYLLVLLSIVLLVVYVHHIGRSLRVSSLIELVGSGTRRTLERRYPDHGDEQVLSLEAGALAAPHSGVIARIDEERLLELATRADCVLTVPTPLGAYVPAGAPLVLVDGNPHDLDERAVMRCLHLELDRNLDDDVAYGMRMLVDIAERSLAESPFLDPTTAVQAIDRLHDCLRQLAPRPFPPPCLCDDAGTPRVLLRRFDWGDYVQLAFHEIRLAGAGSPQVTRRLEEALRDLLAVAPTDRRAVLQEQLDLLRGTVEDRRAGAHDTAIALKPDRQGLGVGPAPVPTR